MKTNTITAMLAVALTLGTLGMGAQARADWVDGRQQVQRERIRDGIASGALDRGEIKRLRKDQRRINRLEERLGADGHYSRRDRRALDRALDRSGKHIARARHGRRGGYGGHRGHRRGARPVTEIHHHYEAAPEAEVVESAPAYSRSLEVDLDGVRVIWSTSGLF